MEIYNPNGTLLQNILVDDNSYRYKAIMGDNNLTLYFSSAVHIEIPIGAYCVFEGETYTLLRPEALKMQHSRSFDYTVIMESVQAKAKMWKFRNPVDGRLKFPLTAKPHEHLQMFVDNMNSRDSGWAVGDCIDGVEQLISYDHAYCWDALCQMSDTFKTEFEIVGKTVSLHKVEYNKNTPLSLSYGRGNGFKSGIGRTNYNEQPPVGILFAQGGDRNIDPSQYGNSTLLLPKNGTIQYDGEHFEDETGFDSTKARTYQSDEQGYSVRRSDVVSSNIAEESLDCSSIYPQRVGTVSHVIIVDADKHFYDFLDNTIPQSLDYSDCQIAGEKMTVIFQDGMLAGREFEVNYHHTASGGNRRFEIVPQEIDGQTMPNATFKPVVGNKYAIFHCMLPDSYINSYSQSGDPKEGAEWDMMREAVKYLYDHEEQMFTFSGTLDGIWAKQEWSTIGAKIVLGGFVLFTDSRFQQTGVKIRIIGVKNYINNPYSPEIELSNNTVSGSFTTKIQKLESQEVVVDDLHQNSIQFTKRRFRDAQETMQMLNDALFDNFSNAVNPITVQTMAMLVGDESLQFCFVDTIGQNMSVVTHTVTYNPSTKILTAASGIVQHKTLDIDNVSCTHPYTAYFYWSVSAFTSSVLVDPDTKYYLYIKAAVTQQKGVAGSATFLLSNTAKPMRGTGADAGYYFFLYGILNSEYDGERSFASMYGFTEILPGRITTDKIVSANGNNFIDLLNNAIHIGDNSSYLDWNNLIANALSMRNVTIRCINGNNETMYLLNGNDGSGHLAGGNISWNSNKSAVLKSKNPTTWNEIEINADSGYLVMRGPSSVDNDDHSQPSSDAQLVELLRIEFQTDPDTLSRIANLKLYGAQYNITLDPIFGLVMENSSEQVIINNDGITYSQGGHLYRSYWYEILNQIY